MQSIVGYSTRPHDLYIMTLAAAAAALIKMAAGKNICAVGGSSFVASL